MYQILHEMFSPQKPGVPAWRRFADASNLLLRRCGLKQSWSVVNLALKVRVEVKNKICANSILWLLQDIVITLQSVGYSITENQIMLGRQCCVNNPRGKCLKNLRKKKRVFEILNSYRNQTIRLFAVNSRNKQLIRITS